MSSASIQKFCGIYSALKCSFDEFVKEKVVSPSYSSNILGQPNQSILKEISPGCTLEGMMLKLKLQYSGHLMQTVDSCREGLGSGGEGDNRG